MEHIGQEYCKGFDIMIELLSEDEELLQEFIDRVKKYQTSILIDFKFQLLIQSTKQKSKSILKFKQKFQLIDKQGRVVV